MKLLRAKKGNRERFFLLIKGEEFNAVRTLKDEFDSIEDDKGLLKKVLFSYFILFAGFLTIFSIPSSGKKNNLVSAKYEVKKPAREKKLKRTNILSLEDIKKITMREVASSRELHNASVSIKEHIKKCRGTCEMRDELSRIEGALILRIDERWRNLRFEAEKALRERDLITARKKWKEILTLIQDENDKRYIYAIRRLRKFH